MKGGNSLELEKLLMSDERVIDYTTSEAPHCNFGYMKYHMIASKDAPIERQDVAGCIEETLHRLLENGATDDEIESITGMVQPNDPDAEYLDGYLDVDLGYVLPGQILWIQKD